MKRLIVASLLLAVCFGSMAFAAEPAKDVLVLEGSAIEVGKMWGEVNKESILKAYNAFLARAKDKEKELRNFAKLSIELSGKIDCPYWID